MGKLSQNQTFAALFSVFFTWGLVGGLNDVLIPHLKYVFSLSYTQAVLVQFVFFTGYLIVSLPAGAYVNRKGLHAGLSTGIALIALGCLAFKPATVLVSYPLFLMALFIIASGITFLQVSANTYVSSLGDSHRAPVRLNFAQGFQSLGAFSAPILGGYFILSAIDEFEQPAEAIGAVQSFYLVLAALLALAFVWMRKVTLAAPKRPIQGEREETRYLDLLASKKLTLGAVGIFMYVGAEVAIGSFLINFLMELPHLQVTQERAAYFASIYFLGMLIGRFFGAWLMTKVSVLKVTRYLAAMALFLCVFTSLGSSTLVVYSVVLIGFCNSIMFPTLFALAIDGLGKLTSKGAGVLCLAIFGGAIIPLLQGLMADQIGLQISFLVPAFCFMYLLYYTMKYNRL